MPTPTAEAAKAVADGSLIEAIKYLGTAMASVGTTLAGIWAWLKVHSKPQVPTPEVSAPQPSPSPSDALVEADRRLTTEIQRQNDKLKELWGEVDDLNAKTEVVVAEVAELKVQVEKAEKRHLEMQSTLTAVRVIVERIDEAMKTKLEDLDGKLADTRETQAGMRAEIAGIKAQGK